MKMDIIWYYVLWNSVALTRSNQTYRYVAVKKYYIKLHVITLNPISVNKAREIRSKKYQKQIDFNW